MIWIIKITFTFAKQKKKKYYHWMVRKKDY